MFLISNVVQGRYFEGEISNRFGLNGLPKYIRESVCGTEIQAFFVESGFLSFGIQNSTQGIRNPASDWNPGIQVPLTRNPKSGNHSLESSVHDFTRLSYMGQIRTDTETG